MIRLWRGWHQRDLPALLSKSWSADELLILCPYSLSDFSFVRFLPEAPVLVVGDWDLTSAQNIQANCIRVPTEYSKKPVLGVFTTGTVSGNPRLVLYSKENVEEALLGVRSFFNTDRIRKIFCYPQPLHTFGLTLGYVQSMLYDLELIIPEGRYNSSTHVAWLNDVDRNTLTLGVPTHFYDLIQYVKDKNVIPRESYSCIAGGARVSTALWDQMKSTLKILEPSVGYGATECAPAVTHNPPGRRPIEDGEIGFAIPGVNLELLSDGVWVSGKNVCLAMIQDGQIQFPSQVTLSDRVFKRDDGMFIYKGRTTLTLNRGGTKYSLELMEETLLQQLGVQAVCVSIPDTRLGDELGVVVTGELNVRKENIFNVLTQTYGTSFNSHHFLQISQLPLNRSQKIDRVECEKLFRDTNA